MLVNGTTLGYKTSSSASSYTNLTGLKEVPDIGADPEMVDNTALADNIIHNEIGIGDPGDMEYVFRFDNTSGSSYRLLKALDGALTYFEHKLKDGTTFTFSAYPSIKVSGGGVNDPQEFTLALGLQSDITVTDPSV